MSKDIDIVIGRILNDFGLEVIKLMGKGSLDIIDEEQAKLLMNATIAIKQGMHKWALEMAKEIK